MEGAEVPARFTFYLQDGLPSNRSIALLAAGFTDAPTRAGMYAGAGVADGALDTGNNAWVGMAFAHFAAASGEACYADVSRDILFALKVTPRWHSHACLPASLFPPLVRPLLSAEG